MAWFALVMGGFILGANTAALLSTVHLPNVGWWTWAALAYGAIVVGLATHPRWWRAP